MKRGKKSQRKLERRLRGHQDLLKKQKHPGEFTAPGSRKRKKQG